LPFARKNNTIPKATKPKERACSLLNCISVVFTCGGKDKKKTSATTTGRRERANEKKNEREGSGYFFPPKFRVHGAQIPSPSSPSSPSRPKSPSPVSSGGNVPRAVLRPPDTLLDATEKTRRRTDETQDAMKNACARTTRPRGLFIRVQASPAPQRQQQPSGTPLRMAPLALAVEGPGSGERREQGEETTWVAPHVQKPNADDALARSRRSTHSSADPLALAPSPHPTTKKKQAAAASPTPSRPPPPPLPLPPPRLLPRRPSRKPKSKAATPASRPRTPIPPSAASRARPSTPSVSPRPLLARRCPRPSSPRWPGGPCPGGGCARRRLTTREATEERGRTARFAPASPRQPAGRRAARRCSARSGRGTAGARLDQRAGEETIVSIMYQEKREREKEKREREPGVFCFVFVEQKIRKGMNF